MSVIVRMTEMAKKENEAAKKQWEIGNVMDVLGDVDRPGKIVNHDNMRKVVLKVSEDSGVPLEDIMGDSKVPHIARARQFAMFTCIENGASSTAVGKFFNRDHTTVLYAARKIAKLRREAKDLASE